MDFTDYYMNQYLDKIDEDERYDHFFDEKVYEYLQQRLSLSQARLKAERYLANACSSCMGQGCPNCEAE